MDKKDMREKNLDLTLSALRRLKQTSKPQLAKETGLSVVTINAIMETLIDRGEAELIEDTVSIGGRPARQYRLNASRKLALGAYITQNASLFTLTTFVVNLFGEVISGNESHTDNVTLEFLEEEFRQILSSYKGINQILLGLDGEDLDGNFVTYAYPELNNIQLADELKNRLNKRIILLRDIHAATIGGGKLEGIDTANEVLVGASWSPSAIDTGILINGKIYKGRNGFAGSLSKDYNTGNAVEDAGKVLVLITRLFNPHEIIFYNEKLRPQNAGQIRAIAKQELNAEVLPNIMIRPDIREDYGEGIYTIAATYLTEDK